MIYPISECFDSIQGEGHFTGHKMFFIRLAGCTVGKPFPKERYGRQEGIGPHPHHKDILPIYTECCTTYDGRKFECDTDYRVKERATEDELIKAIPDSTRRVCITGGEPFMHDLKPLITKLNEANKFVHIETSGTISKFLGGIHWIAVSPKTGVLDSMLKLASEIKLLVDKDFDLKYVPELVLTHPRVYLMPVNYENEINQDNLNHCVAIQKVKSAWIIGNQFHKILKVR